MVRSSALLPAVALLACVANPPAPREEPPPPPPLEPVADDPEKALELALGELLRVRGEGGSCFDHSILVVREDGRFDLTDYPGCRGPDSPPGPKVLGARLDSFELATLQRLLADPGLPSTIDVPPPTRRGSAHPSRHEFLARTPTGTVRGTYIGHRMKDLSPFHAFVYSLYERL